MEALNHDNSLNLARKFAAELQFKQKNYEIAAKLYNEINNFLKAELCYKIVQQSNPEEIEPLVKLADYQRQIGLYNDAKRTIMEAI